MDNTINFPLVGLKVYEMSIFSTCLKFMYWFSQLAPTRMSHYSPPFQSRDVVMNQVQSDVALEIWSEARYGPGARYLTLFSLWKRWWNKDIAFAECLPLQWNWVYFLLSNSLNVERGGPFLCCIQSKHRKYKTENSLK